MNWFKREKIPHPCIYGAVKLDADGRVRLYLPCEKCEYDLRTLLPDDFCPECGHPIQHSIHAAIRWRPSRAKLLLYSVVMFACYFTGCLILTAEHSRTAWIRLFRFVPEFMGAALVLIAFAMLIIAFVQILCQRNMLWPALIIFAFLAFLGCFMSMVVGH